MKYNHLLSLAISLMVLVLMCYSTPAGGEKKSDAKYTGPELTVYLPQFVRPHPPGSPAPIMKANCPMGGVLHAWLASDDNSTATMQYYIVDNCGGTDFTPSSPNPHSLGGVTFDFTSNIDDIKFCTEKGEVRVTGQYKKIQVTKVTQCDPGGNLGWDVHWN